MKNRLTLIAILISALFYYKQAQSQELLIEKKVNQPAYAPATGLRGGFLGSAIHPGFKIGVERPYKNTQIEKFSMRRTKTVYKERYLSYSLGMYHHKNYHTNFFSQAEWIARRQKSNDFYYESSLGLGLSRTFVNGAAYTVSDEGYIEKVPLSGNWYALATIGVGIGYNANLTKKKPYSVYLKHQWLLIFPYNAFVTLRPTIEFGINYNLSGFWDATPKFKYKEQQSRKFSNSQNR